MYDFLEYILRQLQNSLGLVILAGASFLAAVAAAYWSHKRRSHGKKNFPWGRALVWLVFVCYGAVVVYATFFRSSGGSREWNLHLFRAWREAWNNYSFKNWANVLLNIGMFLPLGFLLPLLAKKFRKWYLTIPTGFLVSVGIELLQLAACRGICDVDDLFANTLGTAMGYWAVMALLSVRGQQGKRLKPFAAYGCLLLLPVAVVCGIFVSYETREYGNLPMAAAYTNNTSGTTWTLECKLPAAEENVTIYRTETMSRDDCYALAQELASMTGQEILFVSYYQELAYFNLKSNILSVYYHDGSYEYGSYDHNITQWPVVDQATVLDALEPFRLEIPQSAVFAAEGDGWYSFICDRYIDGDTMTDGVLRCRYGVDDTIRRIENHLIQYTTYGEVTVITPQEAYGRLCAGKFNDGGYYEYMAPAHVSVIDCWLEYEVDTKGFYQPVYYFEVTSNDGSYQDQIMIPAMQ